ncbi:MAG: hypothetical protein KBA82_01970 [Nitrosomonas sp.]|nr:hypothetical protein [Nitrosomonas sp.]MBP7111745.1 hypothetical protein [Nitrosomonas sp.]
MTRDEVLLKIEAARKAIEDYKREGLNQVRYPSSNDAQKVKDIETASVRLIAEARTIGAAGQPCPRCNGSGRA